MAQDNSTKPIRVLIADDDPDARALVEMAFLGQEVELVSCEDGQEAKDAFSNSEFDIAILDVQMPHIGGIELCRWIKQQESEHYTPVMLVTSQSELADKVRGLDCGADDYVTKPFEFQELLARYRALMRVKELTEELKKAEQKLVAAQVAGAAAHELGQPLTALLLNCQLLQRVGQGNKKSDELIEKIEQQCNRMRGILNKLNNMDEYQTTAYVGELSIASLDEPSE